MPPPTPPAFISPLPRCIVSGPRRQDRRRSAYPPLLAAPAAPPLPRKREGNCPDRLLLMPPPPLMLPLLLTLRLETLRSLAVDAAAAGFVVVAVAVDAVRSPKKGFPGGV